MDPTRPFDLPVREPGRVPARRRGGRSGLALLVVVGLLLLVVVAADRAADLLAERALGRGVQQQQGLAEPPDVSIGGFPFLTQAVSGRYRQIDLAAASVPAGDGLTVDAVQVRLTGVDAKVADLTAGRTAAVRADRMTVRARVGYPALDAAVARALANDAVTVRFADGGQGRLALTGTADTPLGEVRLRGLVRADLTDDGIRMRLLPSSVAGLPRVVRRLLADLLDVTLAAPSQVSGVRPTGLEIGPEGITLTGAGTDVPLSALG